MTTSLLGGHRRLLFRTYLFIAVGLLAVAVVLQLGFEALQSRNQDSADPWLQAALKLIESELSAAPPQDRDGAAAALGDKLGVVIALLDKDDVAASEVLSLDTLVDERGDTYYLYAPDALEQLVYLGPVPAARESLALRLLPPLFYVSIFVLVGLWLRPLLADVEHIAAAARRFAADYRVPLSSAAGTTQLTELARDLDDMSARLSGLIQNQKELIAALSHEMRTPLARIRFALAVIDNDADDALRGRLDALNDDVQEIDALIASMLEYARLDHPDLRMHWQAVPLEPWLARTLEKFQRPDKPLAVERAADLAVADMDSRLMGLALSNLVANAMRYAEHSVRCTLRRSGKEFEIAVEDDGGGVPDDRRDTVFKAFTRIDDSRNRETGGYGLGLAVVARIAQLHDGQASVDASPDLGGARFVIRWEAPSGNETG